MRKATELSLLLVLVLTIVQCGKTFVGGLINGNINGDWTATLTNPDGSIAYQFSATFTQGTGSELIVTNFTFKQAGSCFSSYPTDGYAESGSFSLSRNSGSGNSSGEVVGTFGMSIATPNINGPLLTLQGTVSGNTISGTWTGHSAGGCGGNGTFIIQTSMAG